MATKKVLSKREIKRNYSERLSILRGNYVEENGSTKGFYLSDEYKKAKKERDKLIDKADKRIEKERELNEAIELDRVDFVIKNDPDLLVEVNEGEPFYAVLNHGGGSDSDPMVIFDLYDSKKTKSRGVIKYKDGTERSFYRRIDFDVALKQLYRDISKAQKSVKKSGNNSYYPVVSIDVLADPGEKTVYTIVTVK